jgi:hypothetical protein
MNLPAAGGNRLGAAGTNTGTTSACAAPGSVAQPSVLVKMDKAGRIYQNPRHAAELWINFGWTTPGAQLWMPYQPWFSPCALPTDF